MTILSAENTAPYFLRALTTHSTIAPEEVLPQVKLELCVLYLHLFDRNVFLTEGRETRDRFADSLFDSISDNIRGKTGMEPAQFAEFCNERQIEYSRYKELFWHDRSSPAGTLFWEFGKRLGLEYQGYNPIALQLFTLAAADAYISLLQVATKPHSVQAPVSPEPKLASVFHESSRPYAPATSGWWLLPGIGWVLGAWLLLSVSATVGTIIMMLMSVLLLGGFYRMRRNRNLS